MEQTNISDKPKRKNLPKSIREKLWIDCFGSKFNGNCSSCNLEIDIFNYEVGHIQAVAKGGSNSIQNLTPLCKSCNRSMGSQNYHEFKFKNFLQGKYKLDELLNAPSDEIETIIYVLQNRLVISPEEIDNSESDLSVCLDKCSHVLQRGEKKGQRCSRNKLQDSQFCYQHRISSSNETSPNTPPQSEPSGEVSPFSPLETSPDELPCCYVLQRGEKKGQQCTRKRVQDSQFCYQHQDVGKKTDDQICCQILQKGDKKGQQCSRKKVQNSQFCYQHNK